MYIDHFCNQGKVAKGFSKHIYIQQDNAKPHLSAHDPDFMQAANTDGFNMQLICQPPNSPETNINDLGFQCHSITAG